MLTSVFSLGEQAHLNDRLKDEEEIFTFLAPSNEAWLKLKRNHATAHKQLFMGRYWYTSNMLLERHLKIGEAKTAAELVEDSIREDEEEGIQFLRGSPLFFFNEETEDGGKNKTKKEITKKYL